MAVGAGSIKRASKLSGEATQVKETTKEKKVTAERTITKKSTTKSTAARKSVTTKENYEKIIKTDAELLQNTANKVYHITEELPIYLL